MPNDLTCLLYIEKARQEQSKGEPWMSISPRLALETFRELLEARHTDVAGLEQLLQIVRHNAGTPK